MAWNDPDEERRRLRPIGMSDWGPDRLPFEEGPAPVSPGAAPLTNAPPALAHRPVLGSPATPEAGPAPVQAPSPLGGGPVAAGPAPVTPLREPQRETYMPKPLTGLRRGLGALFTGMSAYQSPQAGEETYQNIFVRPGERGEKRYHTALEQYNKNLEVRRQQGELERQNQLAESTIAYQKAEAEKGAEPKTVETGKGILQWNPETKRFDIEVGPSKPKGEGELPLGDRVEQLNQALGARHQVLHPGAPLPSYLTLGKDATQKDFDRIDKVMQQTETAYGTEAQRSTANAMREETHRLAEEGQQEREETSGLKWVQYSDPKTGKRIAGPLSQAREAGATDMALLDTTSVSSIQDARQAVNLITKQGTKPEQQGVMQLVDGLDKDGKLGIAMSRLNSFLAGGVGTSPGDDPRIIALLDKTALAMTLTMKAHFGLSGGRSPKMLEHFLNMANATKMDAPTLRAGLAAVNDYMTDRAAMAEPTGPAGGRAQGTSDAVSEAIRKLRESKGTK